MRTNILNANEKKVLHLMDDKCLTQKEIAIKLKRPSSWVYQHEISCRIKLRQPLDYTSRKQQAAKRQQKRIKMNRKARCEKNKSQ